MKKNHDIVDIEVVVHYETDAAYLVSIDGDKEDAKWLPKSAVEIERVQGYLLWVLSGPEQLLLDTGLI